MTGCHSAVAANASTAAESGRAHASAPGGPRPRGPWPGAGSVDLETGLLACLPDLACLSPSKQRPHGLTCLLFSLRPTRTEYNDTHIEIDTHRHPYANPIDVAEREYRERFRPQYSTTVDAPARPQYTTESVKVNEYTVDGASARPTYTENVKIAEETVEPSRFSLANQKSNMGYYDEDGE